MANVPEFYIDEDLCTECGDCIKAMPLAFRKVEDEEVAEVYNTAGKRKSTGAAGPTDPVGVWSIEIETPLGQSIPAALTIERAGSGYIGMFHSEMGDANLGSIAMNSNSFTSTTSLEMDGHAVEAELFARFDGEQVEGTLKLQNSEALPFAGTKD